MRLIIAGSREFGNRKWKDGTPDEEWNKQDYALLQDEVNRFIGSEKNITIISGLAKGADMLGCQYAADYGYPLEGFAAEWNKHGRSAGIRRNKLMAKSADALIAFWDGKSKGTAHMIDFAHEKGLKVKVVEYNKDTEWALEVERHL